MNNENAKVILNIFTTADGECPNCARSLFSLFLKKYPHYKSIAEKVWKNKFNGKLIIIEDEDDDE